MSISVYLAINGEESVNYPKNLLVRIGYGFHADGTVRIPSQQSGIALIDDMHLPNVSLSAIQILKSKFSVCILDFEREPNQLHKKWIQGFSGKRIIALPEAFCSLAPNALPMVNCTELCNNWKQFAAQKQKSHPNGWMLEITPWHHVKVGIVPKKEGFLSGALCRYRRINENVLYFDDAQTIAQKLEIAETYGCKAAIALYGEVKRLKS